MRYLDALSRLETDGLREGEQPWCDLVLEITDNRSTGDLLQIAGMGTAEGVNIGIGVAWPVQGWRPDQPREGVTFFYGRGALRSLGLPTLELTRLYARWFDQPEPHTVCHQWDCAAVGLNSDPCEVFQRKVSTKFFLEDPDDEGKYAQLFVNVDLPGGFIELREKDPYFRDALVKFLVSDYKCIAGNWS